MKDAVVVSVDPRFSLKDEDVDFWIVSSEANIREAAKLREAGRVRSVTTFNDLGDAVLNVASVLPTIIEHHPSATAVVVRGIESGYHSDLIDASAASWTGKSNGKEVILRRNHVPGRQPLVVLPPDGCIPHFGERTRGLY